jgi:hypothetical protein
MCPPSSDPIRPLGPVAGGVYVGRAELPGRVARRGRRQEAADEQRRESHDGDEHEPQHGETWSGTDQLDTGAYDDHGRHGASGADDRPDAPRPHIDTTA